MVIMALLMTLAVVNLRGTQANSRDQKRKTDVSVIARNIEMFYNTGNGVTSDHLGHYPGTDDMDLESNILMTLRDIDSSTLRAPGVSSASPVSLKNASNNGAQTPSIADYIYQPLTSAGALCTTSCTRFNLYYKLETVVDVQTIKSKNQ